ncbi:MAG: hypothetical protein KF726_09070 [Anaerolineae bacterium]|nr:hypothetical protein [Anaerolineae bacterium]
MKFNLTPRTLAIIGVVGVLLVIGIEGTLTLLRKRIITASISVESDLPTPTPTPTGAPTQEGTPDPQLSALTMGADGIVIAEVTWNYAIGPRFPVTIVHASALDSQNQVVASDQHVIDCGRDTLSCAGTITFRLLYGVIADTSATGTPAPTPTSTEWSPGTYTVLITRAYVGFNAVEVARENIFVAAQ